ncbi:MAG: serine hydrolase [Candidatus Solibacter usitatus]|nr:serine hydrolase [Candidatus Solibacter usitatus]
MLIRGLVFLLILPCARAQDLRAILANRIDEAKKAVGIVVATVDEKGRNVTGYGRLAANQPIAPDGDAVFEIGSITKVFTSLLLADMVERGEVTLDTPVAKLLPADVKMPQRNGKQITLLDLSMQVSGLPRMPNNFRPADPANPFADYDAPKLYAFLSAHTLSRDIGEKYEYSNLGVGLLGHALARKAGMSYENLLKARILDPLGMKSTSITFSEDQKKRLAQGHDAKLNPVKNWDLDSLAGAGAIRSTANDMLTFLSAHMELQETPLRQAMRRMRSMRKETGSADMAIAMGWHILTKFGTDLVWHNGGTAGYRTFAGFVQASKKGVVVLCNTSYDIDDIGRHVLESRYPAPNVSAAKERIAIAVAPQTLEMYAGEYRLAPQFSITVTLEENRLYLQATAQPRFEMFAEKESEFFLKVVDAQITFVRGETGKATHLVLHQNGANQKAERVK